MEPGRYRSYLLVVLSVTLAFNQVDRLALGVLLQDIKVDLALTDTQLGLLTGIAFALFYSVMGIPLAYWADRGNRVTIITVTTCLWSAAVALCAFATTFAQLLLIRIAVAVGEAGCVPPAQSLLAEAFPREERARSISRYMLGVPLSALLGYFVAGWLNVFYGWRTTFLILGIPGLVLAVVVQLTLREPRQERPRADQSSAAPFSGGVADTWRYLWGIATFRHLLICFSVMSFFSAGVGKWQPAFFIRSYGLTTGEIGTWFAAVHGLGGLLGAYIGGELASRYAARNERLQLAAIAVVYCSLTGIWALIYLSPNHYLAFVWMGLAVVGGLAAFGPLFATIQSLVPEQMRAMAVAVLFLFANLIGGGLGPLAAGAMSDALRPLVGEESLRFVLLILSLGNLWGAFHVWRASKTVGAAIEDAEALNGGKALGVI